jgi:hypothetical protein
VLDRRSNSPIGKESSGRETIETYRRSVSSCRSEDEYRKAHETSVEDTDQDWSAARMNIDSPMTSIGVVGPTASETCPTVISLDGIVIPSPSSS